jgi:hypothetical protein
MRVMLKRPDMSKIAAALALVGLFAAGSVRAQVPVSMRNATFLQARDACAVDAQTFCANQPHVYGAMRQCLALHATRLTPGCRATLSQVHASPPSHPKTGRFR